MSLLQSAVILMLFVTFSQRACNAVLSVLCFMFASCGILVYVHVNVDGLIWVCVHACRKTNQCNRLHIYVVVGCVCMRNCLACFF